MTIPQFTDRAAAEQWLRDQAGLIAALRAYGSQDEVDAAIADYRAVAAEWPVQTPQGLPWYVELPIVGLFTLLLVTVLWLVGALR